MVKECRACEVTHAGQLKAREKRIRKRDLLRNYSVQVMEHAQDIAHLAMTSIFRIRVRAAEDAASDGQRKLDVRIQKSKLNQGVSWDRAFTKDDAGIRIGGKVFVGTDFYL